VGWFNICKNMNLGGVLYILFSLVWAYPKLQSYNIEPKGVRTAGCSHAGDFAHQFHIAFSSLVDGACVFAGQPFACAITKFPQDLQVDQSAESSVPNCNGCDKDMTLVYDHCKNHPEWVDVGMLLDYPRRHCGFNPVKPNCIDDIDEELKDDRVFLFRGTEDKCYEKGAMANVQSFYGAFLEDGKTQMKLVNTYPFAHTLPTNLTAYYNETKPAMYDGPGECLRWVYPDIEGYAGTYVRNNTFIFDQTEFINPEDEGMGIQPYGVIYVPTACQDKKVPCKLMMLTSGCGMPAKADIDENFAAYGENNKIIILKACATGGHVDSELHGNSQEIQRGLLDVYGQLTPEYATQQGVPMRLTGRVLRRVLGVS